MKNLKKLILLFIPQLFFTSCLSTYRYNYDNPQNEPLISNKKIAISVSQDGYYGDDVYKGSGLEVSNAIKEELNKYSHKTLILRKKQSLNDFSITELSEYDYIIIPQILHWEDRATAWSGKPDKIEVYIDIYNSQKQLLKSGSFYGESAKSTLLSNDPSVLIQKPIKIFFETVFSAE